MTGDFKLYGIFGFPLGHTLSPAMQEAAFKAVGIKAFYLPFEVRPAEFRRLVRNRRRLLLDGFNVTVPYKERALGLDRVSPEARAIGAVNTVVKRKNRWLGFNTDAAGFIAALEKDGKFRVRGKRVLVLGAGGSARAVIYALAKRGAKQILVANRTVSRARKIIRDFKEMFPRIQFSVQSLRAPRSGAKQSHPKRLLRPAAFSGSSRNDGLGVDLVVNATSVGLKPGDRAMIQPKLFPRKTLFVDLIYRPAETRLLKLARKSGRRTMNGLGMLLYQGAEAFRLWTGKKAPVGVMRKALRGSSQ